MLPSKRGTSIRLAGILCRPQSGPNWIYGRHRINRRPITKGSIDGDKIILEVQGNGPTIKFELTLGGDTLKGEAHGSSQDGQP